MSKNPNQSLESENSFQINDLTKGKVEALAKAFSQIDKNLDNKLSKEEIIDFINSNSKGQQCDPNLINKLISEMDMDSDDCISVEEFIKQYVGFEMNINKNLRNLQANYSEEQSKYQDMQRRAQKAFKEEQSNNDMSKNALVTVVITDMNYYNINEQSYKSICLQIKYQDEVKETQYLSVDHQIYVNQQFEFKPINRQVSLELILKGKNYQNNYLTIGTEVIPLNAIETQNEYQVDITISDSKDLKKELATINSKITFFWSDYLVLRDQMAKVEKRMNKLKDNISKTNMYIKMMNDPINPYLNTNDLLKQYNNNEIDSNSQLDVKPYQQPQEYIDYGYSNNNNDKLKGKGRGKDDMTPMDQQLQQSAPSHILNKIEDVIKKTFKQETIRWKCITKVVAFMLFCFGIINCIHRSDFPTTALSLVLLGMMMIEIDLREIKKYIQWMIYGLIVLIVMDVFWFTIVCIKHNDYEENDNEHIIKVVAFASSCVNLVIKFVLIGVLMMQKNQIK